MFPFNMVIITSTKKKKKKMGQILIFKNILALHFYNSVSSVKWRNYRDVQSIVKNIRILLVKFDKLSKQTIIISFREI